jgi:hypothetical protein
MAKKKNESIIYHGEIIDRGEAEKHKFPVGCKFHFSNVSYNDTFTVTGIKTEPGTEYRQVVGSVAGEVWMLLSSLQKETASGTIKFVNVDKKEEKAQSDSKVPKKAKTKKK